MFVVALTLAVECDGKRLRLEATDSYRLARLDLWGFDGAPEVEALVPGRWLAKNLPANGGSPAATYALGFDGGRCTFDDHQEATSSSVRLIETEQWPNFDNLIAPPGEQSPESKAFDPRRLASIFTAANRWGKSPTPVRITTLAPTSPARFDVVTGDGTLTMLLMPVRIPGVTS